MKKASLNTETDRLLIQAVINKVPGAEQALDRRIKEFKEQSARSRAELAEVPADEWDEIQQAATVPAKLNPLLSGAVGMYRNTLIVSPRQAEEMRKKLADTPGPVVLGTPQRIPDEMRIEAAERMARWWQGRVDKAATASMEPWERAAERRKAEAGGVFVGAETARIAFGTGGDEPDDYWKEQAQALRGARLSYPGGPSRSETKAPAVIEPTGKRRIKWED